AVDLEWTPESKGTYVLWVNATPVTGEDAVDNNAMNGSITAFTDKGAVIVDDLTGDASDLGSFLDALRDDGYDVVNASDAGGDLAAMLGHTWALLPAPGTLSEDRAAVYSDYVRLGGGLLMLADDDPRSYSHLTGPMGLNWSASPGQYDDETDDIGDHPVTDGVGSVHLRSPAASLDIDDGTELIASSNGAVVGAALSFGEGRAVVVSDDDLLGDQSVSKEDNLAFGMNAAGWLGWAPEVTDVGIAMLGAPAIVAPNETFDVSLAVINLGTGSVGDLDVVLRHGGDESTRAVAGLASGEWANLTFPVEFDEQGTFRVSTSVNITDDAPLNERAWREVDAFRGEGAIGVLTYHGNLTDHEDLFRYLGDLGFTFEEIGSELRYEDAADLHALFLLDPDNLEDEEIAAVRDLVRSGKGLLAISDDPVAASLAGSSLGISWGSWPGEEGATSHIASHGFTRDVGSLYVRRPYAQVSGPFLFADYDNGTRQGSYATYGEGRFIGTSDVGLLADDTLWEEDNARFARQAVQHLCRPRASADGALADLVFMPFGERDIEHSFRVTVHNLGSDRAVFNVTLDVEGSDVDTASIILDEGELGEVELAFTPDLNGTYDIAIDLEPLEDEGRTANNELGGTLEVLKVLLDDDCDSDTGWADDSLWHVSDRRTRSGTGAWWYGDEATGDYSTGSGDASLSRAFSLASVRDARLGMRYFLDAGAGDGAEVNISTNGGQNWTTLATFGGLDDRWDPLWIDLSDYEDEDVTIAFRFTHDSAGHGEGLFIEDIWLVGYMNVSQVLEVQEPRPRDYLAGIVEVLAHARDSDGIDNVTWRLDGGAWEEMALKEGSS
ncbi:MAG: hypothetical protein L0Z54_04215, partial [Thermoplasmata archaeon]|nr:hypothetical protein [Thermoplasmata archaeon]